MKTSTESGRFYTWKDEQFWSVTTIIGGGVPKPALIGWAAKYTAEFTAEHIEKIAQMCADGEEQDAIAMMKNSRNVYTNNKADLGSRVHAAVEALVLEQDFKPSSDVVPYMRGFSAWMEDYKPEFEMVEASVFNRERRYAGTLDAIATIADQMTLIDYKSGGVYPEVALQLAAYRNAEFIGVGEEELPMPTTEGGAVLHLLPDAYEWIPVRCDGDVFRTFLYAREIHRWQNEDSKSVLGAPTKGPLT